MASDSQSAIVENPVAEPRNRLAGKVALITGSTRGIGRAIAHAYAAEGARVAICGRNKNDVLAVTDEISTIGGESCGIKIDLSDYKSAIKLVDGVHRAFGRIDILVNNAGILGERETIMESDPEVWEQVMRVNLNSVYWVTKEALGKMVPQNSGSIINVSSGVGLTGKAKWGAYAVSKFGIEGMTQVLADELKVYKVRANTVNPGPTRTQMRKAAYPGEDPKTLPSPADITNAFVYLASDASAGLSGESIDAREWMGRADF